MNAAMLKWALAELERKYPNPDTMERQITTALLNVWSRMGTFAETTHSRANEDEVLDVFTALVKGKPLDDEDDSQDAHVERVWAPASQYHSVASTARIPPGHVSGEDGWKFNGRVGTIIARRRGDLVIKFTDGLEGAPVEHRDRVREFEVDISHLKGTP